MTLTSEVCSANVQTGVRQLEMRRFPLPEVALEDALLMVEGCGICGADLAQLNGELPASLWSRNNGDIYPIIPGHEAVGRIAAIGRGAARRWGVEVGDRVGIEPMFQCGQCSACAAGRPRDCTDDSLSSHRLYSKIPVSVAPALWGGFSEYMYLHPSSRVHRISGDIPIELATLFNPLANAIQWVAFTPRTRLGSTVLILGAGQRGVCGVLAARASGAAVVAITGRRSSAHKLRTAVEVGADLAVNTDESDSRKKLLDLTGGHGFDVVVDTTSGSVEAVNQAVDLARVGGTVVLAGSKGNRPLIDFASDRIHWKELTIHGAFSAEWEAFEQAARLLGAGGDGVGQLRSRAFPLARAMDALTTLSGEGDPSALFVSVVNG